jgi:hypothetical protein
VNRLLVTAFAAKFASTFRAAAGSEADDSIAGRTDSRPEGVRPATDRSQVDAFWRTR